MRPHVASLQAFMLVLAFHVMGLNCAYAQKSGAEPFGLALSVKGEVLLTRGDIEFEAKIEESLFYDDAIETGEDGHLIISFGSSFISVGPNTSFSMARQKVKNGKELIVVNLQSGKFRSKK